jgi:hypothetical protein
LGRAHLPAFVATPRLGGGLRPPVWGPPLPQCRHCMRRRRPCYDLSVWLSAAEALVTVGRKPLVAVREGALVAGAAGHICALGP